MASEVMPNLMRNGKPRVRGGVLVDAHTGAPAAQALKVSEPDGAPLSGKVVTARNGLPYTARVGARRGAPCAEVRERGGNRLRAPIRQVRSV